MANINREEILDHLRNLEEIRENDEIRTNLIFQGVPDSFIEQFSEQEQKLNTILTAIESTTSRIDTVKRNANISTVAGSTVGVVSGALCITGLALAPVTFGVSTALTIAGAATGAAAAISGITTGITEAVLKSNDICKINDLLNEYKSEISGIHYCLCIRNVLYKDVWDVPSMKKIVTSLIKQAEQISENQEIDSECKGKELDTGAAFKGAKSALGSAGVSMRIINIVDDAVSLTRVADVAGDVGTAGVRGVAKGAARVGGIVLSGVFIVVDIYSILSNSIDLSKGSKSRSAAAKKRTASMLRAELTKYRDLYELLQRGRRKVEEYKELLEMPCPLKAVRITQNKSLNSQVLRHSK